MRFAAFMVPHIPTGVRRSATDFDLTMPAVEVQEDRLCVHVPGVAVASAMLCPDTHWRAAVLITRGSLAPTGRSSALAHMEKQATDPPGVGVRMLRAPHRRPHSCWGSPKTGRRHERPSRTRDGDHEEGAMP